MFSVERAQVPMDLPAIGCALTNAAMSAFVPPYSGNIQLARRSRLSTEENVAMAKKEAKTLDELFHDTLKDIFAVE
jgi:hypothetical protein